MPSPDLSPTRITAPMYSADEKRQIEARNRDALEQDLLEGRLSYESRPRLVNLQLSNFCNMSCTMCYDGNNPPLDVMPEDLAWDAADKLLPHASVLVPFANSEPLILTWDLTRQLAKRYGVELDIVTNLQFLDEAKFAELEPLIASLRVSLDSHIEGIFDRIRLRSNRKKVFRNLHIATKLCDEHDIEVRANIVFLVENAPYIDETVAWLADAGVHAVCVQRYLDWVPGRNFSDALTHMSRPWIDNMKAKMRKVAEEKQIDLILDIDETTQYEFLPEPRRASFRDSRKRDPWLEKLKHFYPGYCTQSVYSVKVDSSGNVYPCCVAAKDQLRLGNLQTQELEDVWNGPESRDLRRGMMTWDVPGLCQTCSWFTGAMPDECDHLDFVDDLPEATPADLQVEGPPHLARLQVPASFTWTAPDEHVDRFELVLAFGGETSTENHSFEISADTTEFTVPGDVWSQLKPNMGYWWGLWAIRDDGVSERSAKLRCVIRHEALARIPESTLAY